MKKIIVISALCAGCAGSTLIILQNPDTKEMKECRADAWTTWNVPAEVEACARAYEKAGFKRIGAY